MRPPFVTIVVGLLAALTGCVHTYDVNSQIVGSSRVQLSPDATIFVGVPENGHFGRRGYDRSGSLTTHEIYVALSRHARTVKTADTHASKAQNLAAARTAQLQYLVQPSITHWEDRATEWSGEPDRIQVRLELYAVEKNRLIDSTVVSGKSRWATFGGDHPQELLPELLRRYAISIFAP